MDGWMKTGIDGPRLVRNPIPSDGDLTNLSYRIVSVRVEFMLIEAIRIGPNRKSPNITICFLQTNLFLGNAGEWGPLSYLHLRGKRGPQENHCSSIS